MLKAFRLRRRLDRLKETESSELHRDSANRDFDGYIETEFQIATLHGPLCAEPIAFLVEQVEIGSGGMGKEEGKGRELTIRPDDRSLTSTMTEPNKLLDHSSRP